MSTPVGWFCNRGVYTPGYPHTKGAFTPYMHTMRAAEHWGNIHATKKACKTKASQNMYNCTFSFYAMYNLLFNVQK